MKCQTVKRALLWVVPAAFMLGAPVAPAPVAVAKDAAPAAPMADTAPAKEAAPGTDATPGTDTTPAEVESFPQGILFPYPLLSGALEMGD